MELKRVVVTGLGALTPIGNTYQEFWNGLVNGVSGAAPITLFDATLFKTQFACEIKNFNIEDHFDRKEARKIDRCAQLGIIAAREAIKHSGILEDANVNKERIGVIWGSGIGGIKTFEEEVSNYATGNGTPRFNPFFIPKMIADITPGHISMEFGLMGPNYTTVSACASSTNALIDAYMLLRLGKAEAIVAGGSEAAITAASIGGFNALHALSTRNDDPQTASRPFDKDRDGFVMGEGAGLIVIESLEHALARGATPLAELVGYGTSADAYHLTAGPEDGNGARRAMEIAIRQAGVTVDEIDHINAHATSTQVGDKGELAAIKTLFGAHPVAITSTKSATGHLLGAAGGIEAIFTIQALRDQMVPPTLNLHHPDEDAAGMNLVALQARPQKMRYALSNGFGFGGVNASLLLKRWQ